MQLTNANGTLFFTVDDRELWSSDGTTTGTVKLRDFVRYPLDCDWGVGPMLDDLTNVNGQLFFTFVPCHTLRELWTSDGTITGTVALKPIVPDLGNDLDVVPSRELTNVNGTLFLVGYDRSNGGELWKSDGTPDGTRIVKDIRSGGDSSSPLHLTSVSGRLFFAADDGDHSIELWTSDGVASGTILVKDINQKTRSAEASLLTNMKNKLFFSADDGYHGLELWMSDGTSSRSTGMMDDLISVASGEATAPRLGRSE
jgi:ELWxxDGT repeat protein